MNQKSITDTSLTLLLENNLKEEIMYGKFYEIKVKDSGTWKKLDAIDDIIFTHLGHLVSSNKKQTIKLNRHDFYAHLTPGTYRIEKTFTKENDHTEQQIIAEFDIE